MGGLGARRDDEWLALGWDCFFFLALMSGLRRPVFLRLCCGNLRFWVLDNCAARKPVSSVFVSTRSHVWTRSLVLDNCHVELVLARKAMHQRRSLFLNPVSESYEHLVENISQSYFILSIRNIACQHNDSYSRKGGQEFPSRSQNGSVCILVSFGEK